MPYIDRGTAVLIYMSHFLSFVELGAIFLDCLPVHLKKISCNLFKINVYACVTNLKLEHQTLNCITGDYGNLYV